MSSSELKITLSASHRLLNLLFDISSEILLVVRFFFSFLASDARWYACARRICVIKFIDTNRNPKNRYLITLCSLLLSVWDFHENAVRYISFFVWRSRYFFSTILIMSSNDHIFVHPYFMLFFLSFLCDFSRFFSSMSFYQGFYLINLGCLKRAFYYTLSVAIVNRFHFDRMLMKMLLGQFLIIFFSFQNTWWKFIPFNFTFSNENLRIYYSPIVWQCILIMLSKISSVPFFMQ